MLAFVSHDGPIRSMRNSSQEVVLRGSSPAPRRRLYPPIEPLQSGLLPVNGGHEIYWEVSGNPKGKPVVFLHGGPGGGSAPIQRRFFDPAAYRIVLLDQRGCGKSRPHAALENNTTWDLVADLESLRRFLGVERWQVFGGSWGSTLALLYAQAHPDRVSEIVLRGVFLARRAEVGWFYQDGANRLFPEAWDEFIRLIPEAERDDVVQAYYRRLTSDDPETMREAAAAWSRWERSTVTLLPEPQPRPSLTTDRFALAIARLECHYFANNGFLSYDNQILDQVGRIRHLPCTIVQGRYDVICPPVSAHDLSVAFPEARLKMVPVAGHSAFESDIIHELVTATDRYREPR
ncbi:prolyl aminopeptidase [Rhodothalassium salexigens DSM 2132]|uniref:Proline iminopeptidase n=1 Tax=Rhodothalassium salexigens DSM 2132 TaxID=1188247 RepID=A0A4R2PLE4_RHOSA|nr:prolyl aminopeptidase [Rhodothalassium salexigens DSM 2132]